MNIALVSNLNSGIGLLRDYELLSEFLAHLGHIPTGVQYDSPIGDGECYDLAIFLEVAPRAMLKISDRRWVFANPEWMKPDKIQIIERNFEKVFAKTREAKRVLDPIFPGKVHYTGFLARDQFDPSVPRQPWFLHVGGNSTIRGTQAIIDAFKWKKNGKQLDAHLVVVSTTISGVDLPLNVVHFHKVDDVFLKHLQNQCMFHIYPSATEGFGHAIHEGLSCGAVVMVPDAPPMDELGEVYQFSATKAGKQGLSDLYEVSAIDLYESIEEILQYGPPLPTVPYTGGLKLDLEPRNWFLATNEDFKEAFAAHLEEAPVSAPAVVVRKKKEGERNLAFIGNFDAEHSTENQILWALENRLGYTVEKLQENKVGYSEIHESLNYNDALIWVKTPGWLKIDNTGMKSMVMILQECRDRKIPSISIHLDKFWGIPDREDQIGKHVFWTTQYVWTADGSRQEDFKARNVNHYWMRPAVSEVYCHPGVFRSHYECDVCFVGAKEYHKEYPFRAQLLDFLEEEYGDRFRHIQGVRGHDLNDVYASAKVVVGDCIFAGTMNYWSDRLPETCGRGGFLLHPDVFGLGRNPVATYKPQNLDDLKKQIEFWLLFSQARRAKATECAEYVRFNDTWTLRMLEILAEAGL